MIEDSKIGHFPHLFCFGLGYSSRTLAVKLISEGWLVSGTCRSEHKREQLIADGIGAYLFDRDRPLDRPATVLSEVTDVISSVPPDAQGDPVIDHHVQHLAACKGLRWVGYLSTTGVYGDTGGATVDESAAPNPSSERGHRRVQAEAEWLELHRQYGLPVHVFRLAGIYGPGRSALDQVRSGQVRRIDKAGHVFSRIHVEDIAIAARASMAHPNPGAIYNLCDDMPAAQADVVAHACTLLGVDPPAPVPLEDVQAEMSPMASSFWKDNRRVDNALIKSELGIRLAYPDYRAGLAAVLAAETAG